MIWEESELLSSKPLGCIFMDMITDLLFWTAVVFELIYLALFAWTIKSESFRFWPPPSARSWQFFVAWIVAGIVFVLYLLLGLFDFDSFVLPSFWIRAPIALAFLLVGSALGSWASLSFSFRATLGLGNQLIIRGPYHYSRNPQYIADSLLIVGYFVLTNSCMVGVTGLLGVVLNLLAPFTEESWLEERFEEEYRNYKSRIPRFIGRRK